MKPKCDVCNEHPADRVAFDPDSDVKVYDGSLGIGRIVLFLCKICAAGTVGAMLISAGMKILELK